MKIFLDSADRWQMLDLEPRVDGFTTNPTLMRKAGVKDYKAWAIDVLDRIKGKPISFEVIADDFAEMERQARLLASWGPNVYVKIPITNTKGESSVPLIRDLWRLNLNITAVMTGEQIAAVSPYLTENQILSIFCGRIADTQRGLPSKYSDDFQKCQWLWASTREVAHVGWAEKNGFDIITLTPDLIAKLDLKGKDLTQYSLETVQMFYNDAQKAGYTI